MKLFLYSYTGYILYTRISKDVNQCKLELIV